MGDRRLHEIMVTVDNNSRFNRLPMEERLPFLRVWLGAARSVATLWLVGQYLEDEALRLKRRAERAEWKLEKDRRKRLKNMYVRNPPPMHPFWMWDLALKNHIMWERHAEARTALANMRRVTMQQCPGQGIPLPRSDIHAGWHYNRGPAWGPGWDQP